ncbi:ROK family protein [Micromonospora polyrhachis]|uniref:Glucokinase n=1 Tax=Micromonospora polyrhachis TaxID=1282883 RepID=A0A7W7WS10_9ACTN|nr:ROK family protein [Micromonospora polyrhachis]MBB4960888.1 glucokinase [Micromonospora polyrhachis]
MAGSPPGQRLPDGESDQRLLGIDFGGTKMAVGVADLHGRRLYSERVPTYAERGAEQALERALDLAATLVLRAGGRLVAAGIASPGVIRDDGIDLAPNVPGWERLRLADAVRDRFGVSRVAVANDLNAAALAELRLGALRDADPGLVVGLGTGVAAAVTVRGEVVAGFRGAAGEIAYAVAGPTWPEPADSSGPVEPAAMLEAAFAGRALDQLAERLGIAGGAAGLCAAAELPGTARDALLARVDELARHLATCHLLLDPQRVVLVGGVARSDLIRSLLTDRLRQVLPHPPEIVLSSFADDAALLGAVAMAREALPVG